MKTEEDWEYEKILRQILPEYPMTLKGCPSRIISRSLKIYQGLDSKFGGARPGVRRSVQASRVPKVPYRLLSTPKELLDLVLGRREAIEVHYFCTLNRIVLISGTVGTSKSYL
jgi:hypothetical protein